MSFADIFGDYDFSDYSDSSNYFDEFAAPSSSSVDFFDVQPQTSVDFFDSSPGSFFEQGGDFQQDVVGGAFDDFIDPPEELLETTLKEDIFKLFGVGPETAKAISAFAKAANRGGGKQGQAQGRGRTGPALPSSARAPTTAAGRTSRARQATSGERAVQAAIQQSERATSAARAIANQMARAGTVTSTNDLADMISGSTKPMGTKQKLPGSNLRQLAIPRTQMA